MYDLLVVTDKTEVIEAFQSVKNWELNGYRKPRIVATPEEALERIATHRVDAVAIELPYDQSMVIVYKLLESYPFISVMRASDDPQLVMADAMELGQILNKVYADYSDDRYDKAEMFQLIRHAYFREILLGHIKDPEAMIRHLRLIRSRMDPERACVLIRLGIPEGDGYLADHWHYGPDRLEVAMRNIFGGELAGMRILVSVLPDERLYLLACPMVGEDAPTDHDELMRIVTTQVNDSISHVSEYLNIDLRVEKTEILPSLASLTEDE